MMRCSFSQLNADVFDLLIIGSGIHGAILASAAARSGYRVAVIDKDDFGGSTSANSLKIVHGGIRYLQHLNFKRMRESIVSRRSMMQFAPHLVKPLACLMPTYGHGIKGREMMRIAFGLYDIVACDRNRGLPADSRLPNGGTLSVDACRAEIPGIMDPRLNGAALWYDAIADNTERLLLEYILDASRYGAVAANYLEARSLEIRNDAVRGVTVFNRLNGQKCLVNCRMVVNTAGPWADQLPGITPSLTPVTSGKWAMALNIVVKKRLFNQYAVGLEGWSEFIDKDAFIKRGKRLFFFVPWREHYTMIGTLYKPWDEAADSFITKKRDIVEMVDEVNRIYPRAELNLKDVTFYHSGLLPRQVDSDDDRAGDTVQLEKSTRIIDHRKSDSIDGLISISGVKYTTAPDIARKVLALLKQRSVRPSRLSPSFVQPSGSRLRQDHTALSRSLGDEYVTITKHLARTYGSNWREVFDYVIDRLVPSEDPGTLWLSRDPLLHRAEIDYFIEQECARRLADVVFRRSPLGSAECPGRGVLEELADSMAARLGWDEETRKAEIDSIFRHFRPLNDA
jgi:glycerol-3-phosphate dehydrogenase